MIYSRGVILFVPSLWRRSEHSSKKPGDRTNELNEKCALIRVLARTFARSLKCLWQYTALYDELLLCINV